MVEKKYEQFGLNNCVVQCVSARRNLKRFADCWLFRQGYQLLNHCFWFL